MMRKLLGAIFAIVTLLPASHRGRDSCFGA